MKKIKKSGIVLITTLIFLTLTFMLAVTLCKNGKQSILVGNRYAESEKAYLAAISGIEYIKGQLYADKNWEVTEPEKISSENGILIEKDPATSNLIGYMSTSGEVSNTNYDSKFEIFSKNNISRREFRSINNLDKTTTILSALDKYNAPGEGKNTNGSKRKVPANTFYAYVKGTSGKTVKYAEAMFISNGPKALDGGNIINGKVKISASNRDYDELNPFITLNNKNNNKDGKIKASNTLEFNTKTYKNNNNLKHILNSQYSVEIASNGGKLGNFTLNDKIDSKLQNEKLTYKQNTAINKEVQEITTEESQSKNNLKKGTYAFVNDTKDPDKSYWFYDEEENIAKLTNIKSKTNITNIPANIKLSNRQVEITGDVKCSDDGDVNFIVIDKTTKKNGSEKYTISNKNTIDFSISEDGKIETMGNLLIKGEVTGSGKIYCGNNLTMNAGSILETKAQSGMAIYAENDIKILKTKNLTNSSKEAEAKIISQALQNVPDNITLISSDDEADNEIDEEGNVIPAIVLEEDIDPSFWSQFQQENDINQTTIVINGNKYDVTPAIINRMQPQDETLTFSYSGQEIYKMSISDNKMTIYEHNISSGDYTLIGWISGKNNYGSSNGSNIILEDYNPSDREHSGPYHIENDGYFDDFILKINGQNVGIVDFSLSHQSSYNNTGIHKNDNFFFATGPYAGTIHSPFTVTAQSNSSANQDTNTDNHNVQELTVQEYVENYYKDHIGDTMIKGSIYSKKGNITIDAQKKSFDLTGALITANANEDQTNNKGNLEIKNASHVNLFYDPDYVPFFENQGILTITIFESVY